MAAGSKRWVYRWRRKHRGGKKGSGNREDDLTKACSALEGALETRSGGHGWSTTSIKDYKEGDPECKKIKSPSHQVTKEAKRMLCTITGPPKLKGTLRSTPQEFGGTERKSLIHSPKNYLKKSKGNRVQGG